MNDKFSYYDVIANIVPGFILLGLLIWLFGVFGIYFSFNSSEILGVGSEDPRCIKGFQFAF